MAFACPLGRTTSSPRNAATSLRSIGRFDLRVGVRRDDAHAPGAERQHGITRDKPRRTRRPSPFPGWQRSAHIVTAALGSPARVLNVGARPRRAERVGAPVVSHCEEPMRSRQFMLLTLFATAACAPDSATSPDARAARVSFAASSGEGDEASARAHIDLREVRAELLAVDRAYAEAARSMNLIDALVAPLAPDAVFLAPGPVFPR